MKSGSSFSVAEFIFLALIVIAFLIGIVIMANRGLSIGSAGYGTGDGPTLLKRIGAMVKEAKFIDASLASTVESLRFIADIDDDASTGLDLAEGKGLEIVVIKRSLTHRNRLIAELTTSPGTVRTVVMSNKLDPRRGSFTVRCIPFRGSPGSAATVSLRVAITEGNVSRVTSDNVDLRFAPVKCSSR